VFDTIDALEALGSDADLAGASSATLESVLQRAGAEAAIRAAILAGDTDRARCVIARPDEPLPSHSSG
jgi:hypothetical protein